MLQQTNWQAMIYMRIFVVKTLAVWSLYYSFTLNKHISHACWQQTVVCFSDFIRSIFTVKHLVAYHSYFGIKIFLLLYTRTSRQYIYYLVVDMLLSELFETDCHFVVRFFFSSIVCQLIYLVAFIFLNCVDVIVMIVFFRKCFNLYL